jgi:phosphonate transport system substrate-binding protein
MKTVAVAFILILVFSTACTNQEASRKVSLNEKSEEISAGVQGTREDALWFGFDLRLTPKEEVKIYAPFLKYLESKTGRKFRIKFTERYEDTVENLGKGLTHFAAVGTLSYVIGEKKYGIRYLVSGVNKEGDPRYHAMIITRPKSRINDIGDLKGKSFAFGSKMSTQGHLIPRKMLEDHGITLQDLQYHVYTGSHVSAVKAVLNGECDAGGIQDALAKRLASDGKIKIIGFSEPYPSSLIAYNRSVDQDTVKAVRAALLEFEPDGKHKDILSDWNKTEMPLGFTSLNEFEINKVARLALKFNLIKQ